MNITLSVRVLSLMDKYAGEHGETRCGFVTQSAIEFITFHERAAR